MRSKYHLMPEKTHFRKHSTYFIKKKHLNPVLKTLFIVKTMPGRANVESKSNLGHFHHAVQCQQWPSIARHSRSRNCQCTAHVRQGENSAWQMGEYVFLWHLPGPSHLNQLICNLRDSGIEFSACLQRRLLKRRTLQFSTLPVYHRPTLQPAPSQWPDS